MSHEIIQGRLFSLHWRHNEPDVVSNHQPRDCLLNCLFRCRSKKTSKLRVTGLCAENSPGAGEFPAQKASNAENVSIWWRHHVIHENSYVVTPHLMSGSIRFYLRAIHIKISVFNLFFFFFLIWVFKIINMLRPEQNGRQFADYIFRCIFYEEMCCIFKLSFKWILFLRVTINQRWVS